MQWMLQEGKRRGRLQGKATCLRAASLIGVLSALSKACASLRACGGASEALGRITRMERTPW